MIGSCCTKNYLTSFCRSYTIFNPAKFFSLVINLVIRLSIRVILVSLTSMSKWLNSKYFHSFKHHQTQLPAAKTSYWATLFPKARFHGRRLCSPIWGPTIGPLRFFDLLSRVNLALVVAEDSQVLAVELTHVEAIDLSRDLFQPGEGLALKLGDFLPHFKTYRLPPNPSSTNNPKTSFEFASISVEIWCSSLVLMSYMSWARETNWAVEETPFETSCILWLIRERTAAFLTFILSYTLSKSILRRDLRCIISLRFSSMQSTTTMLTL